VEVVVAVESMPGSGRSLDRALREVVRNYVDLCSRVVGDLSSSATARGF